MAPIDRLVLDTNKRRAYPVVSVSVGDFRVVKKRHFSCSFLCFLCSLFLDGSGFVLRRGLKSSADVL